MSLGKDIIAYPGYRHKKVNNEGRKLAEWGKEDPCRNPRQEKEARQETL
jgi:hypothetical protein